VGDDGRRRWGTHTEPAGEKEGVLREFKTTARVGGFDEVHQVRQKKSVRL